jgi:branched-chain amino acid transport system substrate-binding protein
MRRWLALALVVLAACGSHHTTAELLEAEAPRPAAAAARAADGDVATDDVASVGGDAAVTATTAVRSVRAAQQSGASAAAVASCKAPCSEIKLGSIGTDSGPLGSALVPMINAVRAWEADVNARGGLNGHPVRVISADDGGDPGRALVNARRLVEEEHVVAFLATRGILTEHAYTPYLEQKGVPVVAPCGCSSAFDNSPMLFPVTVGGRVGGSWAHLGGLLTQTDIRDISVFFCREAQICRVSRDGIVADAPALGLNIRHEAEISIAAPDFTAEVIAARDAGAKAIVLVAENATAIRVRRAMKRQNFTGPLSIQLTAHDERFLTDGGSDVEGTLITGGVIPYETARLAAYRAAMKRYVPRGVIADSGAASYVGGQLLEKIATRFGDKVTSKDILDGLYALRRETLGGAIAPLTWTAGSHSLTDLCIVSLKVENGKFVAPLGYDFKCHPTQKSTS